MLSVEEHRARVAELIGELPVIDLPVAECLGLVLAADLRSPLSLPPFDNSAMDGYAVRAADLTGATGHPRRPPGRRRHPGRSHRPGHPEPGTALRIMTGAPLPAGADSVIQVEQTDGGTERCEIFASVEVGNHLRLRGEDVATGDTVLAAGTVLGPSHLGLAAAVGSATLPVRRPRCSSCPPASELVEPASHCCPARSTSPTASCSPPAVRAIGGVAEILRFVPDDVAAFRAALDDATARRRPADHLRWRQRGRLRGGQGRPDRPGRRIRPGRHAAGRPAGRRQLPGRRRGHPPRQPGQLGPVLRTVPAPHPARRHGLPRSRPPDRDRPAGQERAHPAGQAPVPPRRLRPRPPAWSTWSAAPAPTCSPRSPRPTA